MVSDFQSDPTGLSQAKFGLCFRSFILLALVDRHSQKELRALMLQRVFWILCRKILLAPKSQEGDLLSTSGETRTDFYVPYPAILTSDRANFSLLCPELNFKPVCGHDCLRSLNNFASHTRVMTLARFWALRRNSENPLTVICRNHRRIDWTRLGALRAFPGSSSPRILFGLPAALDPAPHALLGTAEPPRKPARGEPQAGGSRRSGGERPGGSRGGGSLRGSPGRGCPLPAAGTGGSPSRSRWGPVPPLAGGVEGLGLEVCPAGLGESLLPPPQQTRKGAAGEMFGVFFVLNMR